MWRRSAFVISLAILPVQTAADILIATRTLRAQSIIMATDVAVRPGDMPGVATAVEQLVGQETRVAIYEGRPIRLSDIGPPAVIQRNQIVPLIFEKHGLRIATEGRSLSRAAPGEWVRVMNMASRSTVSGKVDASGRVFVSNGE